MIRLSSIRANERDVINEYFSNKIVSSEFLWSVPIPLCAQVQRYMCVKKLYMARRALLINLVGLVVLMLVTSFAGLVIYAKYYDCDPVRYAMLRNGTHGA